MSVTLRFEGLAQLYADLRALPGHLRDEGAQIVLDHGEGAKQEIIDQYPDVTGNLKGHVRVERLAATSPFGVGVVVKSTAKHAFIFENGTVTRQTSLGYDRGAMPPGRVFVPVMMRRRALMEGDLAALLERAGLEVRHAA